MSQRRSITVYRRIPVVTLLWIVAIVATITLVCYAGAGGLRGSDQYWYVADAEMLARHHTVQTNNVFPVGLLSARSTLPPPFVHNVLSIYLAATFSTVMGGMWAWLTVNVVSTFATAGLIWLAASRVAQPLAAGVAAFAYPVLPIVFWQTAQPLAEASTALFAAIVMYTLAVAGTSGWRWLLVVIAAGLLYLSRESYLLLLLIAPIGFLLSRLTEHKVNGWRAVFPTATLAVVAALIAYGGQKLLFSNINVEYGYTRLLHSAIPDLTDNMFLNFNLSPENLENRLPFSSELLVLKLKGALAAQFFKFDTLADAGFYWTFNVLALIACVVLWRCRHKSFERRLCLGALAYVGVHFLTITVFQNQFRYLVPAIPGLLVAASIAITAAVSVLRTIERRLLSVMIVLLASTLPVNAVLARLLHVDGTREHDIRITTESLVDQWLLPNQPLLVAYATGYQLFAYAARPRLVLFFEPSYSPKEARPLLAAFNGRFLLAPEDSRAIATLKATPIEGATPIVAFEARWRLYRIDRSLASF
jgi:hypothetical protein